MVNPLHLDEASTGVLARRLREELTPAAVSPNRSGGSWASLADPFPRRRSPRSTGIDNSVAQRSAEAVRRDRRPWSTIGGTHRCDDANSWRPRPPACWPEPLLGTWSCRGQRCRPATYASPAEAMRSPRKREVFVTALRVGIDDAKPDYLATVDVDPASPTYSKVVHRLAMPNVGDELHHFGWNACSSCHADPSQVAPLSDRARACARAASTSSTPPTRAQPKLHKVIEPDEIAAKTNLDAPHTVHCLPDGQIMISMLGDADGQRARRLPAARRQVRDRRPLGAARQRAEVQLRLLVSAAAQRDGLQRMGRAEHVSRRLQARRTSRPASTAIRCCFWDWNETQARQEDRPGRAGHDPARGPLPPQSRQHARLRRRGLVAARCGTGSQGRRQWQVDKVIDVEPVEAKGWPFPVPGLITDLLVSMDDRYLYFSNWLHGDLRQYDISDPAKPKLTGQLWLGGVLGKSRQVPRPRLRRRPADAAAEPRRQAAVRHQLALQQLGQPVLSRHGQAGLDACCRSTATPSTAA